MPMKDGEVFALLVTFGEGPLLLGFAGLLWYQSRRRRQESSMRLATVKSETQPGDDQRRDALVQYEIERLMESQNSVGLDASRAVHWSLICKWVLTSLALRWFSQLVVKFGLPGKVLTTVGVSGGRLGAYLFGFLAALGILVVLGKELYSLFAGRPYWVDPVERMGQLLRNRISE
jgi:hypothetical protein